MSSLGYTLPTRGLGAEEDYRQLLPWSVQADGSAGPRTTPGVDYHGGSLHHPIQPKVLRFDQGFHVIVRYAPGSEARTIPFLEKKWQEFVPGHPFRYEFFDESLDSKYRTERRIGRIVGHFTGISVLIACLGLFGLTSFMAERRTKEIGVRKVMGATLPRITVLLTKDFLKWIGVAIVIALPSAYFAMQVWLNNFAYRTAISAWTLVLAAAAALVIALATISYQSFKSARANPADCLRYE